MSTAAPLTDLQEAVVTQLSSKAYFSTAPAIAVMSEKLGDIENRIQAQLGKLGIVAIVTTPVGPVENPENPVPAIRPLLVVTIIENVLLNRASTGTREPADKVALGVAHYLHQKPDEFGYMLTLTDIRFQEDVVQGNKNAVAYSAVFQVQDPIVAEAPERSPA